ncbi:TPA: hypothetical protein ACJB7X_000760, partial [Acinetobacter baumannii]
SKHKNLKTIKKPILKQVGFFMSGFDSSCQSICLKNSLFLRLFLILSGVHGKNYPQFLRIKPGQLLARFVRPGAQTFRDFAARGSVVFCL